jgi:hypothetical protein
MAPSTKKMTDCCSHDSAGIATAMARPRKLIGSDQKAQSRGDGASASNTKSTRPVAGVGIIY